MIWTPRRAMLVLVGCNLLWAGTYAAAKEALAALSPVELNCIRFLIAGLAFAPLLWLNRQSLHLDSARLRRLALLCLLGFVLNKAFEFYGLKLSTASDNALLITTESLFTAILGWVLLKEQVRQSAVIGLVISVVGVYLVIERGLVLPRLGGGTRVLGDLLIVTALTFEALYTVVGKAELEHSPAAGITAACVIGSLVVWAPAAAVNAAVAGLPHLTGREWLEIAYLAILGTTVPYALWTAALRYVDAAAAAPTLFLQPLFGTIIAVLLLRDRLTWATVAGGFLIIAGIWIVSIRRSGAATSALLEPVPHSFD
jgi:drug/metabolite transporter (DMT)-like permease